MKTTEVLFYKLFQYREIKDQALLKKASQPLPRLQIIQFLKSCEESLQVEKSVAKTKLLAKM